MSDLIRLDDIRDIPDMTIGEPEAEPDSWEPRNLAELPDKPPIQPTLGNAGITYPGKRHVFSGPQESAKTLAAYAISHDIIRAGGQVVVIDFEMGAWEARNRMRELGYTDQDLAHLHYIEPADKATPARIQRLINLQPELVIIDAAAGAYDNEGLDDNKRADVERFTRIYVREFWRADIATIVLDHVVKNADTRGNYAIGSERKVGGADVHLGFAVVTPIQRGGTGIYKITTHKDRGGFLQRGRLADMHLSSDPDTHAITWEFKPYEHHDVDDDTWRPTGYMEKVSRAIEFDGPMSGNQIEKAVEGKNDYIRKAVKCLVKEGFVSKSDTGRGHEYEHIRIYRQADDLAPEEPRNHAESDLAPTSPHLAPGDHVATSPLAPLSIEGAKGEVDYPDDSDIPF